MVNWARNRQELGAAERIRTSDPRITNALLYRLSYRGVLSMIRKSLPSDLIRGWKPVFRKDHAPQKPQSQWLDQKQSRSNGKA
jgi:hypothetical protein